MPHSQLLALLSIKERQRLSPYIRDVQLRRGEELLQAGGPIHSVWLLHDCVTSTIVDSADGTTIEVGLMGYEGMVGLSAALGKTVSNTTVIVQIPGSASQIYIDDFMRHVVHERSELFNLLLHYTDGFMAMVAQTAACNSLHSVDERLARWMLMVHDRLERDDMPLTQEYIAHMLGVRRPSISLAASGLQQMGIIRYGRGQVTVVNRKGLEDRVCSCYGIVRNIADGMYMVGREPQRERA